MRRTKQINFEKYKIKWGLTKYRFFPIDFKRTVVISQDALNSHDRHLNPFYLNSEIVSVDTLIKRQNNIFILRPEQKVEIEFNNLHDLLEHTMIEKIAFGI